MDSCLDILFALVVVVVVVVVVVEEIKRQTEPLSYQHMVWVVILLPVHHHTSMLVNTPLTITNA